MKIYDISQELFQSKVYPGQPKPSYKRLKQLSSGDDSNVTQLTLCSHNGTHADAPRHFFETGKSIDQIPLEKFVGECTVVEWKGSVRGKEIDAIAPACKNHLLIKGDIEFTLDAAKALVKYPIDLIGIEGLAVGPKGSPAEVHLELLGHEIVIIEGLVLTDVAPGEYFLSSAPLKLGDTDGAPCRSLLVKFD
jgi:arylformamidase